jgi:hypothetical protein
MVKEERGRRETRKPLIPLVVNIDLSIITPSEFKVR